MTRSPSATSPHATSNGLEITRNSFGGFKMYEPVLGAIDAWTVEVSGMVPNSISFWQEYLGHVDFGLNAVAFIWPEREVVIHPRWLEDLEQRKIEKMAIESPRRELQPLRAIALAHKMSSSVKRKLSFAYGPGVLSDCEWLAGSSDPSPWDSCFSYLKDKIASKRWPPAVVDRVRNSFAEREGASAFVQAFDQTIAAWMRDGAFTSTLRLTDFEISCFSGCPESIDPEK
jgi:hypothetical protein